MPSIFSFKQKSERQNERHLRLQHRREKVAELEATTAAAEALLSMSEEVESLDVHTSTTASVSTQTDSPSTVEQSIKACVLAQTQSVQACPIVIGRGVQTDFHQGFGASFIEGSDPKTNFYTGLPSWDVFEQVYLILIPHIPKKWTGYSKLQPRDELLLVLMRLCLNLLLEDISHRFGIQLLLLYVIYGLMLWQ